ncbi:MerR family transcriptional regulator [Thalassomonas haliotis]|uniref:MerR family transcriptional regulator n=1 Tax=Thalassomonas haliotis TaxID=485448 RepID=A0ABY7VJ96_9GAMM|nr:MerR family transcriptional regulator [Thalassomonas haliotis]WDE13560.1 MerR family transcriptional regulator [Thalassomonas haliotis]
MAMSNENQQIYFPIRELSARTNVNTVTLRAWERRHGLLTPKRTEKGHRLYCEQDVAIIEKVLALVARGVPLGKVKPLLKEDALEPSADDENENWQQSIAALVAAVEMFSVTKLEHLIHEFFANYPVGVCRERLIEPVFALLVQRDDKGAAFGFLESELIRYTLMRLSAKVSKKKQAHAVTLIAGEQAPMWCLALMALELTDLKFSVYLFNRAFSVAAAIELAEKFTASDTVFYQDGLLKEKEHGRLADALGENERMWLCGTAPVLTQFDQDSRVFGDVKSCISGFAKIAAG